MDEKSKIEMTKHYSDLLRMHGPTKEAMVYSSEEQQNKRYALLADVEVIAKESSILDVGCGLGYLCGFLRRYGWKGRYTGIDINPDMILAAKKRLPKDNFICIDILTEEFTEQFDYVFCGATVQHKPKYSNPNEYLEQMVKKMFSCAKKALAFDVFSSRVDYMNEDRLYVDPAHLLNFCYTLTTRVVLRNDARPYEIMLYLYKKVSKNALNIYRDWTPKQPSIT